MSKRIKLVSLLVLGLLVFFPIKELGSASTQTTLLNDEFSGNSLENKWAVVAGSQSSVDLLATNPNPSFSLTAKAGFLATQTENNHVFLRQDAELSDEHSVILKLHPAVNSSSNINNEAAVGIILNCADNNPHALQGCGSMSLLFHANEDGWEIEARYIDLNGVESRTLIGETGDETSGNGQTSYLRIARRGLKYFYFVSFDNVVWTPMKTSISTPRAFDNLWLVNESQVDTGNKTAPIQLMDWLHETTNTL